MQARFARRLLLLAAAAAAIALGAAATTPALAGDVTFWTWRQEDRAAYAELFAQFTRENPDIRVRFEAFPVENYQTIVSTSLAGGRGGDVLHVRAYGGLEQFARAGYLMPFDKATVPELANFSDAALAAESLRSDKRVYAVPFASQTLGVLVNKEVFQRAGLQPPTNWAELVQVGRALKEKGIVPIANGMATAWMDEVFAGVFTGPLLGQGFVDDILAGRATFADPRYVAALTKLTELKDLMPPGYAGIDYATAQQLFLSGRAAIFAGGSFEIANFRKQNPRLDFDFIAPPAPEAGQARPVSLFYDGGYAVNAKSANQADALKLVRWMGTKDFGDRFSALLGNISPISGVEINDPLLARVAALNAAGSVPYIMAVYFRYDSPTGSELLQKGIQQLMSGQASAQQVGQDVTAGIARYYQPFQK